MDNTKQVLIWRNDLKVRKGKVASQVAHASMAFLTKNGSMDYSVEYGEMGSDSYEYYFKNDSIEMYVNAKEIDHWLRNSFRKICVYVNSEEELLKIHQKALDNGLMSHIVEDNGTTEFNGVKTLTACAIGPHFDERFIGITDHLPLL